MEKLIGRVISWDRTFSLFGMTFFAFFIIFARICFQPFDCIDMPWGGNAWSINPAILCYEGDHISVVVVGVIAVLIMATMLAMVTNCVVNYQKLLDSEGFSFVIRTRFLFFRFRPGLQWWMLGFLARSVLITLLPVVFAGRPALQIISVGLVLAIWMYLQQQTWPWGRGVMNIMDGIMVICLIIMLIGLGLLTSVTDEVQSDSQWAALVLLFGFLGIVFLKFAQVLIRGILRKIFPGEFRSYDFFICHQAEGAGALARLVRQMVVDCGVEEKRIFFDGDANGRMDIVENAIMNSRQFLLIVTPTVWYQKWPAIEMCCAYENKCPIVVLDCCFDGCRTVMGTDGVHNGRPHSRQSLGVTVSDKSAAVATDVELA